MSANKHTNPAYISHVHLKGYKSIIDTEVELHPGLNIIIGPNGSGKTNFLEFLKGLINIELPDSKFDATITIIKESENYKWRSRTERAIVDENTGEIQIPIIEWIHSDDVIAEPSTYYLRNKKHTYRSDELNNLLVPLQPISFISFHIPKEINGLSSPLSLILDKEKFQLNFNDFFNLNVVFINRFIIENFLNRKWEANIFKNRKNLLKNLAVSDLVLRNLKKFSPIAEVRISEELTIRENGIFYHIENLGFEFLVNNTWLSWNMLSDGTKRLFYLITEVTLNKGLCLVEEPELGTYPKQLDLILNFLKEESEEKQIIITTHAPRTLDILENEDLKRIILSRYDKEFGTKMRHLSKEEQIHAVKFMREESFFLSDFWTWTDFFEEEEII